MKSFDKARELLKEFKGDAYLFGNDVLKDVGDVVAHAGCKAALVVTQFPGSDAYIQTVKKSVAQAGITQLIEIEGAQPNAPLEDLARITNELITADPDVLVSFGGGSTIDAAKAAEVLRTLGGKIEDYFGVGLVTHLGQHPEGGSYGQTTHPPCGHSDRCQFSSASDQVLQHHRHQHGPEEAHRR